MQPATVSSQPCQVRRRCVFYLSGFDPKGAAHYHSLYRDEAVRQAKISGMPMAVGRRQKTAQGDTFWTVSANPPEGPVETHYQFLRWDDIVRDNWPRSQTRLILDLIRTTWLNLRTGSLWRMLKLAWPPAVALFAPFLLLCAVLLGVPLLAATAMWATPASWGGWPSGLLALAAITGWMLLARQLEKKYSMAWLLRSYAFTAEQAGGKVPTLDVRLAQHAETVLERINSETDDEVLLVGHSSGTIMAASVLAKALRRDPQLGSRGPVVSLLTLGHCMPMLACLPQAQLFRDDLALLAGVSDLEWLDFSAPPDGCCFALTNPLLACGQPNVASVENRPKLLSPRFAEMFEPAEYAAIRRDKFRMHFQYLMAGRKTVLYDYFAITAGAHTLAERFKGDKGVRAYTGLQLFRK